MEPFRFKQFAVSHDSSPMRVGTDGVILGAVAPVGERVLDVGCGCGLIGLMMAQRGAGEVEMVDIDRDAVSEATANAVASPWADRITVCCVDYLEYMTDERFDVIVSNPPFFANCLGAPDSRRAAARSESALPAEGFMRRSAELLVRDGKVCVIVPADREAQWVSAAAFAGLGLCEAIELKTKPAAAPKRVVLTFSSTVEATPARRVLALNSAEYRELTSEFYL